MASARIERLLTRALSRRSLRRLNEALFLVSLRGLGFNAAYGDPIPYSEQRLLAQLSRRLPSDATILDVGANKGLYSLAARRHFPNARIIAFEPNPQLRDALTRTLGGSRVEVINLALGEREGRANLYGAASDAGSTFASLSDSVVAHAARKYGQIDAAPVEIEVASLDTFAKSRCIPRIDLLKIDVEGHELSVLRGAQELIRSGAIQRVQMEFNECSIFTRVQFRDIAEALRGYRLGRLLYSGEVLPLAYDPKWCEICSYQVLVAERTE